MTLSRNNTYISYIPPCAVFCLRSLGKPCQPSPVLIFFSSLNYTLYIIEIFLQRRVLSLFRACLRKICRVDMLKHSSSSYLITIINYFLYTSLRFPRLPLFVSFFFLFLFLYFLASPADPMIINSSPFIPIYAHFTHSRTIISVPSSNIIIIISLRL